MPGKAVAAVTLLAALSALLALGASAPVAAAPAGVPGPDEVCDLLSTKQVRRIMGGRPFGSAIPDAKGCSWETDPTKRETYRYVYLRVIPLDAAVEGYPDFETALDEGTTTLVIPIDGLGDEAYTTKTVLVPEGSVDGFHVVHGELVVELTWQARKPVAVDSARYERIADIVAGVLEEV